MKNTSLALLVISLFLCSNIESSAQNLLNTSTWTVGSGSVSGFNQNGPTSENSREIGKNHIGQDVILWKATPGSDGHQSGGWNTNYIPIDHTKTYRFTVWLKKTNSNSGTSYLGCNSPNHILRLNGTVNNNPYFWTGDLPKLNRWYLIVGYVHRSDYSLTTNLGRIYDGVTGEEVATTADYKFKPGASTVRHRSYLYYDSNTSDRQYFYAPRIDNMDDHFILPPTITDLLSINPDSQLKFAYDEAGNQKQRFYCDGIGGSCIFITDGIEDNDNIVIQTTEEEQDEEITDSNKNLALIEKNLSLYPNPTDGNLTIKLSGQDYKLHDDVNVYSVNGALVKQMQLTNPKTIFNLDISDLPSGVYFLHMHFTSGDSMTKKIIKN